MRRKTPHWQKSWRWPWNDGRPRNPFRGLERMKARRARGKLWKWLSNPGFALDPKTGASVSVRPRSYEVSPQPPRRDVRVR